MLQVGLIGLGPEWEQRFRPALGSLSNRIHVRSVYATASSHAEQAAAELNCDVAPGLLSLIERDDVRALLILETDWHAEVPAWLACQLGKPAFLGGKLANRLSLTNLQRRAADSGVTFMPDLGHRYTPATSRLRELMATRLGRPLVIEVVTGPDARHSLDVAAPESAAGDLFAVAVDWCISLIGTAPVAVVPAANHDLAAPAAGGRQYDVEFRRPSGGGDAARARIQIHAAPLSAATANGEGPGAPLRQITIQCAKGRALLKPPYGITWEVAGERVTESLTSDRSDAEVMFDHFSRRVLGGLIPVPTLDDVSKAREVAARLSLL